MLENYICNLNEPCEQEFFPCFIELFFFVIRIFQVSLLEFKKFFMSWVAEMIFEAWNVQLERAHSFAIYLIL